MLISSSNEKVFQWEENLCQCLFFHTSQKAQLRAPLSPLQTAWTGFDLIYIAVGHPQQARSGGNSNCKLGLLYSVSHNALVEYKDLAVAISTRARPAEDDPLLYKYGRCKRTHTGNTDFIVDK